MVLETLWFSQMPGIDHKPYHPHLYMAAVQQAVHAAQTVEPVAEPHQPITFEIDGEQLVLPDLDTLIVGRASEILGDTGPQVNLKPYQAREFGVSRQHARITRLANLVYVTDLGSSSGTQLNGWQMPPSFSHVVNNGDILQLGRLKVRVLIAA